MHPTDSSTVLARERYADLLRDAERERQLNALNRPMPNWPGIAARWRLRRSDAQDRLRSFSCRAAPAPCPD
jgi:hypothetical protein